MSEQYGALPDPADPQRRYPKRSHILRKFSSIGWHLSGDFFYSTPLHLGGVGRQFNVKYEGCVDPWGESHGSQLTNYKIVIPDDLHHELMTPVRRAAKKIMFDELDRAHGLS